MKKELLLATTLLTAPSFALAQTLPNPTFIPAWDNQGKLPLIATINLTCSTNQFINGFTSTGLPICATPTTGSSTAAAGSSGQFQVNSAGSLAGVTISGAFTIDGVTGVATLNTVPVAKGGTGLTTLPNGVLKSTSNVLAPAAAPDVPYAGTGTAPITRDVGSKFDSELTSIADYAVSSASTACATDSAVGIQNAFNKAGARTLYVPPGFWCYGTTLTSNNNQFRLRCDPGAVFVKITATGDGLLLGAAAPSNLDDGKIQDCQFQTKTGVTPTSGTMVHVRGGRHFTVDNSYVGTELSTAGGGTKTSFNSWWFDGVERIEFHNSGAWGAVNDCILANGSSAGTSELHLTGGSQLGACVQKGVHIAGNLGGIYCESIGSVLSGVGFYVDTSISATANREFFLQRGCIMDSGNSNGYYFAPNSVGLILGSPWAASNGGDGLQIDSPQSASMQVLLNAPYFYGNVGHGFNGKAGNIVISGGTSFNNGNISNPSSGFLFFGGGVQSAIITGVRTDSNAGYGIDDQANAGVTKIGAVISSNDQLGKYRSVNGLGNLSFPGPVSFENDPSKTWSTTVTAGAPQSIASGGIVTFPAGSGEITTTNFSNGNVCKYLAGGGGVVLLNQSTGGSCVAGTASPGAGLTSVYFTGSLYAFRNQMGGTVTFTFKLDKTRDTP